MTEPKRIQLSRTKGWRKPDGTIVVARPSRWGNWYAVRHMHDLRGFGYTLDDPHAIVVAQLDKHGRWTGTAFAGFTSELDATTFAVDLYRRSLEATYLDIDGPLNREHYLGELRGHDLACWCPITEPCHADVLLELANQ